MWLLLAWCEDLCVHSVLMSGKQTQIYLCHLCRVPRPAHLSCFAAAVGGFTAGAKLPFLASCLKSPLYHQRTKCLPRTSQRRIPPLLPLPLPLLFNRAARRLRKRRGQNVTAVVKGDIEQRGFGGTCAWGERKGGKKKKKQHGLHKRPESNECRRAGKKKKKDLCLCA